MRLLLITSFLTSCLISQGQDIKALKACEKKRDENTTTQLRQWCFEVSYETEPLTDEEQNYFSYHFEKRFWALAGAKFSDPEDTVKQKLKRFWDRVKQCVPCEFNKNILKFALDKSKTSVIDIFVSQYGLDINFIDSYDGKNLYDYAKDNYLHSYSLNGPDHDRTKFRKQDWELVESLGGKTGHNSDWEPGQQLIFRAYSAADGQPHGDGTIGSILEWSNDFSRVKLKIIKAGGVLKVDGVTVKENSQVWVPFDSWTGYYGK